MAVGIIGAVLIAPYVGLVFWMLYVWKRASNEVPASITDRKVVISVVIPYRNEETHLALCLNSVLQQSYPHVEIIAVNDGSTDASVRIANELLQGPHRAIDSVGTGKKAALNTGIQASGGTLIATLDADTVVGPDWLKEIAHQFDNQHLGLLIMPVRLRSEQLKDFLMSLEFLSLMGSGIACAAGGKPLMANGANLAFRRTAFDAVGGYSGHAHISSGDDHFLVRDLAHTSYEIKATIHPHTVAESIPPVSWKAWFSQRIRWGGKSRRENRAFAKWVTALVLLANLTLVVAAAGMCLDHTWLKPYIVLTLFKSLADCVFLLRITRAVHQRELLWVFPWLMVLNPFLLVISALLSLTSGTTWKGREVVVSGY